MPEEISERKRKTRSLSMPKSSQNSGIPRSTDNKKSSNIRIFALPLIVVLVIFGTFLTGILPLQSLLLGGNVQEEHTIEVSGYAWNLLDEPVIDVLIIPNPNLLGWRDSYSEDARQAFRDWIICTQLFVSKHGYSYLSEIRFAVYIAGVDGSVDDDYDITVQWVDHFDSHGAAGSVVVLSNSDKEITKASITLPISVNQDGETYYLSGEDTRNIMADEIGHALGLGHSNFKEDALYGFYDFPHEIICHSSLDMYGLATVYKYIPTGEFEPPAKSTLSLQETGIPYYHMRSSM